MQSLYLGLGLEAQMYHFLAVWPWGSYLNFLWLPHLQNAHVFNSLMNESKDE